MDAKEGRHILPSDADPASGSASPGGDAVRSPATSGNGPLLAFSDLKSYEWLNLPAWVYDGGLFRHWWANAAGLRFWRADSLEELCSRSYADTSDITRARIALSMQAHARGETTYERWTLYPRGEPTSILLQGTSVRLPDGRIGILFMAELGMQMEPNVIRGVEALNHAAVLVAVNRLSDGQSLFRNPAAVLAFGAGGAAASNAFVEMFADRSAAAEYLARVTSGEAVQIKAELQTRSGSIWHLVGARRALDPATGEAVALFHAIDIAELMTTQRALERARERAEAASRAKSAFLGVVNHELRTPINGLLGTLHLIERTSLESQQRRWLQMALASGAALSTLIEDLVELAAIDGRDQLPVHELCDVRAVIQSARDALETEALRKGLEFGQEIAADVPQRIVGDARLLRRTVFNLVANAVKFTAHGSVKVHVGMHDLETGRHSIRIDVTDTGMGVAPAQQEMIFRPFVQGDQSSTRRHPGVGLGLTLVRGMVEKMGGYIELQSALGQGSRFSVVLPIG